MMHRVFAAAAVVVLPACGALAQSVELLEAVRMHSPRARQKADAELEACARASCQDERRIALLAAYLALSEGDAETAGRLLARGAPVGLEPWHAYYEGQAAFYVRDYPRAARLFEQALKGAPPSLRARAQARLGEALVVSGEAAAAVSHLQEAARAMPSPEVFHHRALAREAAGDASGARGDRVTLAVRFAAHPYGEAAKTALLSTAPSYRFTFEERQARAESLLEAQDAVRALAETDALAKENLVTDVAGRAKLALLRARVLFALGRDRAGQEQLDQALKGAPEIGAEAALLRARRALKLSDRVAARKAMAEVVRLFPSRPAADEAHFYMGWLDLQRAQYAEAVETFSDFLRQRPGSRRADEALWFRSLAQLRLEEYAPAKDGLDELLRRFPRSSLVPQGRYWSSRAAQLGGGTEPDTVAKGYEEVIALFPGSFYALLAQVRLKELGRPAPPPFPNPPSALEENTPPELMRAVELSKAGLFRDAALEVEAQLSSVRNPADALRFGHALHQLGEYGQAHALATRHLWGAAFGEKQPAAVALFYPRAFRPAVERESRAHKVPASFLWAIMRRESGFRPDVASPADARGLMQIIPPTALAISRALGDTAPAPDALFAPEISIRYGAWYLAKLWERFQHPALAAAAYNAGAPAVVEWVNGDRLIPLDLFVELIPYRETRGYVKQVLADFQLYESLYRDDPSATPRLAMTLPKPSEGGVNF